MGPSVIPAQALDWGVPVIAGAPQSKSSAPLPVPQRNVDDARLVGRSRCEADMMGVFVQVNENSHMAKAKPIGYVIEENGCWSWVGSRSRSPGNFFYGNLEVSGKNVRAHRWMYEREKGPIPGDLVLDHLCRNTLCVNPDHLEAVTNEENVRRGVSFSAQKARLTHCPDGHPYAVSGRKSRRERVCFECQARKARERYHAKKRANADG